MNGLGCHKRTLAFIDLEQSIYKITPVQGQCWLFDTSVRLSPLLLGKKKKKKTEERKIERLNVPLVYDSTLLPEGEALQSERRQLCFMFNRDLSHQNNTYFIYIYIYTMTIVPSNDSVPQVNYVHL